MLFWLNQFFCMHRFAIFTSILWAVTLWILYSVLSGTLALNFDHFQSQKIGQEGSNFGQVGAIRPTHPYPSNSIWRRLEEGFELTDIKHPDIDAAYQRLLVRQDMVEIILTRARPYLYLITQATEHKALPLELALLPAIESSYDTLAYSHGHASGLWQFIPSTAREYDLRMSWWYDGRRDVWLATQSALSYIDRLARYFDGDYLLALAAYNGGIGNVQRAIQRNKRANQPTDFWHLKLKAETMAYVPKLLALARFVADSPDNGVRLPLIKNQAVVELVTLPQQMAVAEIALLAQVPIETVKKFNPALNQWATDPDGPYHFLMPIAASDRLKVALENYQWDEERRWVRHRVRQGETLGVLAARFHSSVSAIKSSNHLANNLIMTGDMLVIPTMNHIKANALKSRIARAQSDLKQDGSLIHRVRKGDSLWEISRNYEVALEDLKQWNDLKRNTLLHPGQLVYVREPQKGNRSITPPELDRSITQRAIKYRIRSGDSLSRIGKSYGVSVDQLCVWNQMSTGDQLKPGQSIKILVDVAKMGSMNE